MQIIQIRIILNHLVHQQVFLVGENVERHPEIVRRIVREGHTIGIHCYNHDYKALYQSAETYVEDFEHARRVVYETCGVEAQMFRFPGGSINNYNQQVYAEIIKEMTARGYIYYDWNVSSGDASSKPVSAEEMIENIKSQSQGYSRVMILMHDTNVKTETVRALPGIIETLQSAGYQIVPIKNNTRPVQHVKAGYMQ